MTAPELAQLITAISTLVAAIGGVLISIRNTRKLRGVETVVTEVKIETSEQTKKIEAVRTLTEEVKVETNGMKAELVAEVRAASLALGRKEGAETERALHPRSEGE